MMDIVDIGDMSIADNLLLPCTLPSSSKAKASLSSAASTSSPSPLSAAIIDIAPLASSSSSISMMDGQAALSSMSSSSSSSSDASDTASNNGDTLTFSSSSLSSPGPSTPPFASSKAPSELDIAASIDQHHVHAHKLGQPEEHEIGKGDVVLDKNTSSSSSSSIASTSRHISTTFASTSQLPLPSDAEARASSNATVPRSQIRKYAADIVRKEAKALLDLAARLDSEEKQEEEEEELYSSSPHRPKEPTTQDAFSRTVDIIKRMNGHGRIIMTGVGKSGLLARKAVATFNSFGIPSAFLHPVEALHGDLGLISPFGVDTVILISYSGRTRELLELLHHLRQRRVYACISLSCPESALAEACDVNIDVSLEDDHEAEESVPAPTSSVVTALAALDALALTLLRLNTGWEAHTSERRKAFGLHHPGGSLGQQLSSTREPV